MASYACETNTPIRQMWMKPGEVWTVCFRGRRAKAGLGGTGRRAEQRNTWNQNPPTCEGTAVRRRALSHAVLPPLRSSTHASGCSLEAPAERMNWSEGSVQTSRKLSDSRRQQTSARPGRDDEASGDRSGGGPSLERPGSHRAHGRMGGQAAGGRDPTRPDPLSPDTTSASCLCHQTHKTKQTNSQALTA